MLVTGRILNMMICGPIAHTDTIASFSLVIIQEAVFQVHTKEDSSKTQQLLPILSLFSWHLTPVVWSAVIRIEYKTTVCNLTKINMMTETLGFKLWWFMVPSLYSSVWRAQDWSEESVILRPRVWFDSQWRHLLCSKEGNMFTFLPAYPIDHSET